MAQGRVSGSGRSKPRIRYSFFISLFLIIYIVAQLIIFLSRDTTSYIVAKKGEIVDSLMCSGVAVREESLIKASTDGIVQYYYPGGRELMKNTLVCTLLDDYYGNVLEEKINEIYSQIQDVDNAEYQEAFDNLDADIAASVASFLRSKDSQQYKNVYDLETSLKDAVSQRKDMYSLMNNTKVAKLLAEQGIYIDEQNSVRSNLYLSDAGIIDYSYDRFEGWTVDQIGPDFIDNYDSHYAYFEINMQSIDAGTPLYRLVTSPVWHIVSYLTEEEAAFFSGEEQVKFVYNSSNELRASVASLEKVEDNLYKLVLKLTVNVQKFMNDRIVNMVFTKNSHTGIKISESCIVKKEAYVLPRSYMVSSGSSRGVLLVNGDTVRFASVKVLDSDDVNYYILLPEGVEPGALIQKENSVEQMRLNTTHDVTGVYIVNGGYEEFETVRIVSESQGYVIVEGIQLYDRVKIN